jgi:hypothetical protein
MTFGQYPRLPEHWQNLPLGQLSRVYVMLFGVMANINSWCHEFSSLSIWREKAWEGIMKKGKRFEVAESVLQEAQRVLEVAAEGGEFNGFAQVDNNKAGHEQLRQRALEILAGQFENVDIEVIAYPNSEYVDIQAVPAVQPKSRTNPEAHEVP